MSQDQERDHMNKFEMQQDQCTVKDKKEAV